MTALARFRSPLGPVALEATDLGLCGASLGERTPPRAAVTRAAREHLDLRGSEFDRLVWSGLLRIPFGETRTYGELAAALGIPSAARAVGAANGRNPIWILVPCHRVVAAGGALGGYAGGLEAKRWLLAHEAGHAPSPRAPAPAISAAARR